MLLIIITILGVSFILYTLLGGADFGAGIVETVAGRKGERIVSKAIAPVWEANHVWLILAIVILFTGFPLVYATISVALHIPLMIVLLGIVMRGTSFTFRHYDVTHDKTHAYYSIFFKASSFITPVFLGITLGAMILGNINLEYTGSFYEQYIAPWFNLFCLAMGLFSASLFGYIAAVFLIGEATYAIEQKRYVRISKIFLFLTIILGVVVFLAAEQENHQLFNEFFQSSLSIGSFAAVALLTPVTYYLFNHPNIVLLRIAIGLQVTLIMLGWFAIQFPILVYEKNGNHLTFYNTQAPYATLYQLLIALIVGLLFVLPAFYFLFKVFKKDNGQNVN
ncbi:cytochrome d ubiquinol oxidase subunit II [Pontibacter qinzhouensis]|uniref:Cytochrome d ubiquinol oxidase subunit II n=1 Tax=Pontibacter qinzhouensis TaxID=2603253 RepID=A0A5C8K8A5_9BACT|nr:cytochrome d ubiquinol oxidase subunit II [Pontibacter qinzhouensis]TXK45306.1 cytochrome d ubiquinol oxidase subunit II [Pontibacter qinzhouensis]